MSVSLIRQAAQFVGHQCRWRHTSIHRSIHGDIGLAETLLAYRLNGIVDGAAARVELEIKLPRSHTNRAFGEHGIVEIACAGEDGVASAKRCSKI
jgi:hypothetical protein